MGRRLPMSRATPTVDAMRKRLGGRASTDGDAGAVVVLRSARGLDQLGVVLFSHGEEVDVWTDSAVFGLVHRTRRANIETAPGPVPLAISRLAKDARVFARLAEGSRVRYATETGEVGEGLLLEKCRYGAIVARDDGRILGIGFRRVWPASEPDAN